MNPNFGCGHFAPDAANVTLSPALDQLRKEHIPLRKMMSDFHDTAQSLLKSEAVKEAEAILNLREQIDVFFHQLKIHSEREEGALFPMMGKHIGTQVGPIAVMEYEHEQAKNFLTEFLARTESLPEADTEQVLNLAVNAYAVLDSHFTKEEQVLFPMAERILSDVEKKELQELIQQ